MCSAKPLAGRARRIARRWLGQHPRYGRPEGHVANPVRGYPRRLPVHWLRFRIRDSARSREKRLGAPRSALEAHPLRPVEPTDMMNVAMRLCLFFLAGAAYAQTVAY